MAARRPGTAAERAKAKRDAQRAAHGTRPETIAVLATTAQLLLKVLAPPSEKLLLTELTQFQDFVREYLLETDQGKAVWEEWAEGLTVEEVLGKDDRTSPKLTVNILHPYLWYRCSGMRGTIHAAPSLESVENVVHRFWYAYKRKTRVSSDYDVRTSGISYCQTTLKEEFNLHTDPKPRRVPDRQVLLDVVQAILSPDLVNEITVLRFNALGVLNLQVASGTRIGALIRSTSYPGEQFNARGLCWKDKEVWIFPPEEGEPYNQVLVKFKLRFTKTETGANRWYKMWDADVPAFQGATLILALGVADGVFEGDPTLAWLLNPEILQGKSQIRVSIKEEWLERPVFHQTQPNPVPRDGTEGCFGDLTAHSQRDVIWRAERYDNILKDGCHKAGYPINFASHDMRVLAVLAALSISTSRIQDVQYSIGHSILSDKWTKYLNGTSLINFQSVILGEGTARDKLHNLSCMRLEKEEGLPFFLSLHSKSLMYDEEELVDIRLRQRDLKQTLKTKHTHWKLAPVMDQHEVRDLYKQYRLAEQVLYRKYLKLEVKAYLKKANTLPAEEKRTVDLLDSLDISSQVDAMPEGEAVDYDLDSTSCILATTDFTTPDSVLRLLSGDGDVEGTLALFRDTLATAGSSSATSGTASSGPSSSRPRATPLGPTPSQLLMPPPPLPASSTSQGSSTTTPTSQAAASSSPTPSTSGTIDRPDPSAPFGMPTPRVKKAKAAVSKAAADAQRRSRSASVSSVASSGSNLSDTSRAVSVVDDTYKDSVAFHLDKLCMMALDPKADRLDFFTTILNLPPKTNHLTGWWPGMNAIKIGSQYACPHCRITVKKLTEKLKPLTSAVRLSKLRKHIFDCTQSRIKANAIPQILLEYDQSQACPLCLARDPTFEADPEISQAGILRNPKQWYNHLVSVHDEGDVCACGHILKDNTQLARMHLSTVHNIMAEPSKGDVAWEAHCREEFAASVDSNLTLPVATGYGMRDDVPLSGAVRDAYGKVSAELDSISAANPITHQDGRFQMIVADSNSGVVTKFGYCMFCAYDETLTWTNRMVQFTYIARQRNHVMAHLLDMYAGRKKGRHYCCGIDEDEDEDEDQEKDSDWSTHRYHCPDSQCHHHSSSLSMRQFCNHIYISHRAWDSAKLKAASVSTDDAEFIANLRILFKNVQLDNKAKSAGFPMDDEGSNTDKEDEGEEDAAGEASGTQGASSGSDKPATPVPVQKKKKTAPSAKHSKKAKAVSETDEEEDAEDGEQVARAFTLGKKRGRKSIASESDDDSDEYVFRSSAKAKGKGRA